MTQDIGALADAIDPRIFRSKAMMGRARSKYPVVATAYPPDQKWLIPAADLFAASDALRSLTTAVEIGRAMGREEAAKVAGKFAASYAKAADEDANGSESYRGRCKEAGEVLSFIATAIRSATPTLDVEALAETVAEALYLHERPTMYEVEAQSQSFADLTKYARYMYRDKASCVLRALGIGGTAA